METLLADAAAEENRASLEGLNKNTDSGEFVVR